MCAESLFFPALLLFARAEYRATFADYLASSTSIRDRKLRIHLSPPVSLLGHYGKKRDIHSYKCGCEGTAKVRGTDGPVATPRVRQRRDDQREGTHEQQDFRWAGQWGSYSRNSNRRSLINLTPVASAVAERTATGLNFSHGFKSDERRHSRFLRTYAAKSGRSPI